MLRVSLQPLVLLLLVLVQQLATLLALLLLQLLGLVDLVRGDFPTVNLNAIDIFLIWLCVLNHFLSLVLQNWSRLQLLIVSLLYALLSFLRSNRVDFNGLEALETPDIRLLLQLVRVQPQHFVLVLLLNQIHEVSLVLIVVLVGQTTRFIFLHCSVLRRSLQTPRFLLDQRSLVVELSCFGILDFVLVVNEGRLDFVFEGGVSELSGKGLVDSAPIEKLLLKFGVVLRVQALTWERKLSWGIKRRFQLSISNLIED